jgi:hypothetical protein
MSRLQLIQTINQGNEYEYKGIKLKMPTELFKMYWNIKE